jgi:hypothetical protein
MYSFERAPEAIELTSPMSSESSPCSSSLQRSSEVGAMCVHRGPLLLQIRWQLRSELTAPRADLGMLRQKLGDEGG